MKILQLARLRMLLLLPLAGCIPRGPDPIAPAELGSLSRDTVLEWVAELALRSPRIINVRPWRYLNDRGSASGRGAIRLAPPDSLRFDFRGPFGKSGAAVIIGRTALWMRPEGDFNSLVRVAPVFWAALGHPPAPPIDARIEGLVTDTERVWRYADGGDTLTFIAEGTPVRRLRGEMRTGGRTIALSEVVFDSINHVPTESKVEFPLDPARFSFQIRSVEDVDSLAAETWDAP